MYIIAWIHICSHLVIHDKIVGMTKTTKMTSFRIVKDMDIVTSQKRTARANFLSAFMAVKEEGFYLYSSLLNRQVKL